MSTSVKYTHSELPGAPVVSGTSGSRIAMLDAALCTGWGLITAQSAVVAGGVCTLSFATGHVFEPGLVALVAGAGASDVNGEQRISAISTNTVSFPVTGVADGPVSGTISIKIAPAGWEKIYSGTNKAAYRSLSPDTSGAVLRVDDSAAGYARIRVFSSMSDVDTGLDPTPTDAQIFGGLYMPGSATANATPRRWIVVASDRFVHVMIASSSSYPDDYASVCAGDFPSLKAGDAYNVMICGDVSDTSSSGSPGTNNALHASSGSTGAFIMRPYTQIGSAIPAYLYKPGFTYAAPSGTANHPIGPNPINNGIELSPTLFLEGNTASGNRRGEVPGLYGIPHYLGASYDSKARIVADVGLPGHTLMAVRYYGAPALAQSYRFAIDITNWE